MILAQIDAGSLSGSFTLIDWLVLVGYLLLVSVLGVVLAGKQHDMEDFFRGGGRLPWYAVSASMIATIISAVTFIGVPAISYAEGGDFTYLQFGIIAGLLSRIFVTVFLVPAYYNHQVYSPYDYMGARLGEAARSVTTAMFTMMGLLAQASRVYLTALVLELVLADQLAWLENTSNVSSLVWAIGLVGVIAIIWTMLGGIATVIWTDAMLFLVFVLGGLVALGVIAADVPGGLPAVVRDGWAAGKFKLWSLGNSGDTQQFATAWGEIFARPFTLWAAIFAVSFGNIGSYGTDQLLAQRIFTCRSQRDAQIAVMASWVAELVAALMLLVGVGLWAFYRAFPEALLGDAAAAVADKRDNIFPVFILTQVPVALRGLIVAGIFAAAISSLTSILAALAQTTVSAVYLPLFGPAQDDAANRRLLRVSRSLIVVWGVALCAVAVAIDAYVRAQEAAGRPVFFLNLALGLANYGLGTLFAAFLLAWLPMRCNAYGLIWSAPLSVACVVACRYHWTDLEFALGPLTVNAYVVVAGLLLGSWLLAAINSASPTLRGARLQRTIWLLVGCGVMWAIARFLWFGQLDPQTGELLLGTDGNPVRTPIAWPWYAPVGGAVAFTFGWLLADRTAPTFRRLTTDDLKQIVALWQAAAPWDPCTSAVLREKLFEDDTVLPSLRLGAFDANRLVGMAIGAAHPSRAFVKLICVSPEHRRRGVGSALLASLEKQFQDAQLTTVRVAESAPNYLTPGVDQRAQETVAFFKHHGYQPEGEAFNQTVKLAARNWETTDAERTLGEQFNLAIRRATPADWPAIQALLNNEWPSWQDEVSKALQRTPVAVHVAVEGDRVVAFAAHDGNNAGCGWFGPMGTAPSHTGKGLGRVLLWRCLADLKQQGLATATIPWVGPLGFYEKHAGATLARTFVRLEKTL